jgi:hypothetical protein
MSFLYVDVVFSIAFACLSAAKIVLSVHSLFDILL